MLNASRRTAMGRRTRPKATASRVPVASMRAYSPKKVIVYHGQNHGEPIAQYSIQTSASQRSNPGKVRKLHGARVAHHQQSRADSIKTREERSIFASC